MKPRQILWAIAMAQLAVLVVLGWHFRHALNTDAVAYIRIASYYADGNVALAVSGYWGPLLSWLMAGFLKLGVPELVAARLAMMVSAQVFLWGCVAVFESFRVPRWWCVIGAVLAALAGAYWSALEITPDLLLAGIIALAVSRMCDDTKTGGFSDAVTGLLWGLAYLTKAIALPLGCLTMLAFAGLDYLRNCGALPAIFRQVLVRAAVFALVAAPWVATLSLKYHQFTFSTTARISHALTGPPDVDRYHPFARTFHQPEPGRITSWEEPSLMAYRTWSPFESAAYLRHQIKVVGRNLVTIAVLLTSLNLGWWLLVAAFWCARRNPESPPQARWNFAQLLVIPVLLSAVYLPFSVLITQQRFFYAAFPFFFAGLALWTESASAQRLNARFRQSLVIISTCLPLLAAVMVIGDSTKFAGECAVELANRIQAAKLVGPIAGSGSLRGGRAGLYVGFLLKQPWHGDELAPIPASLKHSGARLVVVKRNSPLAQNLSADAAFTNADGVLFPTGSGADDFPLQIFEVGSAAPKRRW
ncbi:MAG: hypothetical protein MUF81_06430 [Verrucomicrobia bacterium]|jgi:hypothetical protein|nr:hypothetical protein [Verrucomicrobiota bacterium]